MRVDAQLVKSQKKASEMALSAGNIGIWEWNIETDKITWSPEFERIHGLKKGEFGGSFKDYFKNVHPGDSNKLKKFINDALKKKNKYHVQYRVIIPNGQIRWLEAHGQIITKKGKALGMVGVCFDISAQKKIEEDIMQTTRQLKAVFQSVPEGITVENQKGEIIYANEAVAQLFGAPSLSAVVSQNIKSLFKNYNIFNEKNEKVPLDMMPAAIVFKTKRDHKARYLFIHKKTKEQMWIDITATPVIKGEDSVGLVVKVFQDITQVVEDQRQREIYLGLVGHELKNPLASIKAYVGLLKLRLEKKEYDKLSENMDSINEQAERLIHLIGDMMDVTRIQAGKLELHKTKTDLNSYVRKVVSDIKVANNSHKISTRIPKKIIYAKVDKQRLTQVITNLINNAQKYSPPNSNIYVSLTKNKDGVCLNVRDCGYGVPKNQWRQIFQLYSQIGSKKDLRTKGLGMGLFISRAIIKAHGGKIILKSKVNKGSTFTICLPV